MENMGKILFVGPVNFKLGPNCGSEYKNQMLISLCEEKYDVSILDTTGWSRNPMVSIRLVINLIFHFEYDAIVISASSRSTYRILSVITLNSRIAEKIIYYVIGGYLPTALENKVYDKRPFMNIRTIVMETPIMNESMLSLGMKNSMCIPNFKRFPLTLDVKFSETKNLSKRFVYLGRITPEKGINEIFSAIKVLNSNTRHEFYVDFYGPVAIDYKELFTNQLILTKNATYRGQLNLMKEEEVGYQTLSEYDIMLFPTYWIGEGLAGVIIDAKAAGLPVIASNWAYNRELITEGESGLLVEPKNYLDLASKMELLIQNDVLREKLAQGSFKSRLMYHYSAQKKNILNTLENHTK